jgi:DNA-binding response OmpR family regulator
MRILVVEDEERLASSVARGLRAEGFDVDITHDGLDGLWRAREIAYAAIVLDILLPGMNGYKVCAELRSSGVWTPILMLTAKDGEYDEAEALDTGADDYLRKPFAFVVLVARLRALIRRGASPRPPAFTVGNLSYDPATRVCSRGGVPIELTPREAAVLEHLMAHRDSVVSKMDLLDAVWGFDFEGDPNVVEVYVGYLRRKIDRPFSRSTLRTIRGLGYRVVDE